MSHAEPDDLNQRPDEQDAAAPEPEGIAPPPAGIPPVQYGQPMVYPAMGPKRPGWPKVIGIISIVLASLGLICTPISLAMNAGGVNAEGREMLNLPEWYAAYELVGGLLGIGFAVLLLVAGIMAVKYRPVTRMLHLIYAVAAVLQGLIGAFMVMGYLDMSDAPDVVQTSMRIGVGVGIVISMAYPVFLLIWFGRSKSGYDLREAEELAAADEGLNPYQYSR